MPVGRKSDESEFAQCASREDADSVRSQLVAAAFSLFFIGPFFWAVASSFKSAEEIGAYPPALFPHVWHWQNYLQADTTAVGRWTLNSIIVTSLSVIGLTTSCAATAYSFARFRFPGRDTLFICLLGTLILPREATLVPLFILFRTLHWLNTLLPLTVPNFLAVVAVTGHFSRSCFVRRFATIRKRI